MTCLGPLKLPWLEGEKKLGTSFSLPNLSEPWQFKVFFLHYRSSSLSADHLATERPWQTATEENHTYLSPDVQAAIDFSFVNEVIRDMGVSENPHTLNGNFFRDKPRLVGGLEHFLFLRIIIPID